MSDQNTIPYPPPPPRPPLKEFGGYEIEQELGRGGMGVVYLARQVELNRRVALKMLTGHYGPDELRRFLEEAETAAGLTHTNIAHVYEVGEHEGTPFFSMEYVEGGSLADRLRKELPAPRDAARLLIEVARALHFAHQKGVVHRDMKPANVLLDADGVPKVADFGIAKRLNSDNDIKLTRTGAVIGTPSYMAPEQARGNSRHAGPAADIYSLGVILYEMLAGRPPFLPEDSEVAVTLRVLTEDPVSPAWHRPNIPRDLETICMKCLQKEPRARYASAAALAEDLRRFLDDESILAKPPSTVGNSIKWVRRHPWKFIVALTSLLLVIAGAARLVQWEMYQRPHVEYAAYVKWVNGGLEPVTKIGEGEAAHRATYVRLTRSGRFGHVVKAEVLNARGHPAVLRRISLEEMIPLYIEGLVYAQPYSEAQPESTTVEFIYDGDTVQEAKGRDRNGHVNWRILYDRRSAADLADRSAGARFVNVRGFDAASHGGASHMEFERDARGYDTQVTFFDAAGKPAANGEGVYGYRLPRDDDGRPLQIVNLGSDGQPAPNRAGVVAFAISWGQTIRLEVRDTQGQPSLWNGIATFVSELDAAGNATRVSNLDREGQLVRDAAAPFSLTEMKRNERGELTQRSILKAEADGSLKLLNRTDIGYDEFGHPADIQFTGPTSWRTARRYDANGNDVEEKFLDAQGNPVAGENGYAIRRFVTTAGPQGVRTEQTYFDAADGKTYCKGGYHRQIDEFSATGVLRRQTMDEHDPSRFQYYRLVSEPEFDPQGRLRHSVMRYENAQGQPAAEARLPYTTAEEFYDEEGRLITEWQVGRDPAAGGPVWRIDTEWHPNGKTKRPVRQICDANRQPLPFISNGTGARFEEEFDAEGRRVRIYETGFDEGQVGFSTREAKFSGGSLQSVTHTRGDGTVLKSVRVLVTGVAPEQPKAAELKAGDQLVAANGKPVTSAYAWVFAGQFPGGWLEVLREGRRVRIEGFAPGKVGVFLEDRAPAREP